MEFFRQRLYYSAGLGVLLFSFLLGLYGFLYAPETLNTTLIAALCGGIIGLVVLLVEVSLHHRQGLKSIQSYLEYIVEDKPPNPLLISSSTSAKVRKILRICHRIASNQYKVRTSLSEKAPEKLQKIDDVEQMKNMIDNLHHELKTPMHSILSFSSIGIEKIEKSSRPQPGLLQYFQNINKSGQRLLRIIDSVLTQVKMEEKGTRLVFSKSNLTDIVRCAIEEMRGLVEDKKQTISLNVDSSSMSLVCDFETVIQVVINLLGNAIKFSPIGGEIKVHLKPVTHKGIKQLEMSVADQGEGVPKEEREKIFARSTQGKNARGMGGAGLGLSISKEILNLHGGKIWVEDNETGGATFKFTLPVHPSCSLEEK